jgi:hypothetical protein
MALGGFGRAVAALILTAGFWGTSARAAVILDSLTVRIYDNAGVLAAGRARAIKRANDILGRADLAVEWRDCPASGVLARGACAAPPRAGELAVRLVRSPKDDPHPRALGTALIDKTTGTGTLATVFVDRVADMARQGQQDPWTMIGSVMAHEIGHLLLGTNSHSDSGLMREIWTVKDLTRNRPDDWLFSRAQRDELRQWRLSHRTAPAPVPAG